MNLTKEYLEELFTYSNGELYWKVNRCRAKAGQLAGRKKKNGYCEVRVDGKLHGTHRLIYLMHKGNLPRFVDHIDGNPSNNLIENLREATHAENMRNSKKPITNTSGFKGVYWDKRTGKWVAQCNLNGEHRLLGYYTAIVDAAVAVKKFREEHHKEFANHG